MQMSNLTFSELERKLYIENHPLYNTFMKTVLDIQDDFDSTLQDEYERGEENGYNDGYSQGKYDGYDDGWEEARELYEVKE